MSRNAVGAVAVICVSGFAGCAATARAEPSPVAPHPVEIIAPARIAASVAVKATAPARFYVTRAAVRRSGG